MMVQVSKKSINIRGRLLDLSEPLVMGILNITPDSFYAGSRLRSADEIVDKAGRMLDEGAAMLDVGGYSTRPGAAEVGPDEEAERVCFAIETLIRTFPGKILSVDTFRAKVAEQAVNAGAHIINDVGGGTLDAGMFDTVARLGVPYILMHMRGTPGTMNRLTGYGQLIPEILADLQGKLRALRSLGVADVIIDPGFGFAKTIDQNFELLAGLQAFSVLGCPVLAGLSRKATIYKTLGTTAENALNGTTALNMLALERGASILRVHDVQAAAETVKLWKAAARYIN